MIEGRYSSLGMAIYKTMHAPTDHPAFKGLPIQAWLYNGLRGARPYLEEELKLMRKDMEKFGPEIEKGRQMNLDQLKEEVRWVTDAIETLREMEREKGLAQSNELEIEKDQPK